MTRFFLIVAWASLLGACAKPLPTERSAYVGEWKGGAISLAIMPEGRVIYERKEGHMSKSIDAPLKEFKGDNFIVGVGFMSTEFIVSAPPHEESGLWKMTVDGIELTRKPQEFLQPEKGEGTTT
jgi:hypothetical protein